MFLFRRWLLLLAAAAPLLAEVRLPALISDHMLLQQGVPVRIWGRAEPGEAVRVEVAGQQAAAEADAAGRWSAYLKPLVSGGPHEMTITGRNKIVIRDVLVGEVWVGSGQSNMQWTVARSDNAAQEIAQANYPEIRLFQAKMLVADQPAEDTEGAWRVCAPDAVKDFSAVGYYFARELHQKRRVPVGLIQSAWGGTPAQSWTSRPALEAEPALKFILDDWQRILDNYPAARQKYEQDLETWKPAAAQAKAEGRTPPAQPRPPQGPGHQNTPSGLFNAMIAPLTPYAIRGAIWYQGESNASKAHAYAYRRLFRTMIEDWRRAWGLGDFPFLFVQLANFQSSGWWPLLRESQVEALGLRSTGMAVTIDIGMSKDIHPTNKQEVGRRLALWARAVAHGESVICSGPLYRQLTAESGRLRVWFDQAVGGLDVRGGGSPRGFEIAGEDGRFVAADARLEGETVVVSSAEVKRPVAVRYAWTDDPVPANLMNKAGLPASPFRTGAWPFEPTAP